MIEVSWKPDCQLAKGSLLLSIVQLMTVQISELRDSNDFSKAVLNNYLILALENKIVGQMKY